MGLLVWISALHEPATGVNVRSGLAGLMRGKPRVLPHGPACCLWSLRSRPTPTAAAPAIAAPAIAAPAIAAPAIAAPAIAAPAIATTTLGL